jgi:hypothetical protein
MYVSFRSSKPGPSLPNQALIGEFSVAIWNKNKFAVAFAIIAWLTNFSIIIQGKTLPFYPTADYRESHTNIIFVLGVARVNNQSRLLWTT